jgi:hypothetical protein
MPVTPGTDQHLGPGRQGLFWQAGLAVTGWCLCLCLRASVLLLAAVCVALGYLDFMAVFPGVP